MPSSVFVPSDPSLELPAHLPHPPSRHQEPVLQHHLQPHPVQSPPLHGEAGHECRVFPVELGDGPAGVLRGVQSPGLPADRSLG